MPILEIDDSQNNSTIQTETTEKTIETSTDVTSIENVASDKKKKNRTRPFRSQEEMKTSILFNKEAPLENIIRYPRGMKWEVSYFLQIRDLNDTIGPLDLNLTPSVQKYNRINKMLLILQSAITQDNIENITGEAIVNAGFLPNVDDLFLVTLTGGREVLFHITEVQTRTYNIHKAYYISFKIYSFVDQAPQYYNDLINKVMKEYVYDRDHLLDYSAPVILAQDYKTKINLKDYIPELTEYYMDKFINHSKNVLALPTTASIYIDPYLTDFIFKIINFTDNDVFKKLHIVSVTDMENKPFTIWDLILRRDPKLIKRCNKNLGFKYHSYGLTDVMSKKMNFLGINFIVSPLEEEFKIPDVIKDISTTDKPDDYEDPVDSSSRAYVLSKDFYSQNSGSYSRLESCLMNYLNGHMVNTEDIDKLLEQYMYWDTIDQYYLIPILLVLVKECITNTFKSL